MDKGLASRKDAETRSRQWKDVNEITAAAMDSAVRIQKDFGPGLMDSVYEAILHRKLLLTYLKLSGLQVGLLLNFGAHLMRDGIARLVCDFNEK